MGKLFKGKNLISGKWIIGCLIETCDGEQAIIPTKHIEKDGHHVLIDSDFPWWIEPETLKESIVKIGDELLFEGDKVNVTFPTCFGKTATIKEGLVKKTENCEYVIESGMDEYSLHYLLNIGYDWEIIKEV